MIRVVVCTNFDAKKQEETFETVELSADEAQKIVQAWTNKFDYKEAKRFADRYKKGDKVIG